MEKLNENEENLVNNEPESGLNESHENDFQPEENTANIDEIIKDSPEKTPEAKEVISEDTHDELPEDPHEEHEAEHSEEEIDFTGYTKQELLDYVKSAIENPKGRNINKKVQYARGEFNRITREEKTEALEHWKAEGKEESDFSFDDPIVNEFNTAFKAYKKRRLEYINELNREKEHNLEAKKTILERLKTLTEQAENKDSFNEFKKLQDDWRKIGHVPINEAENIWNTYNVYVDKFYDQRSLYNEFKDLDRKKNLKSKEEIVGKIESLSKEEDINEALRQLKIYQDEWRHIGPVPKESLEELINRYKAAVIEIYERKEKQSEDLRKIREQNYQAKLALLEKIEEFGTFESASVQDWISKNKELGEWIEKWRSIGSVPIAKSGELKERFSTATRQFNKNKNNFFRSRKKEKVDNLRKKVELCELVEKYTGAENPLQHRKEVIQLQADWRKIGPLPAKYSDKIWKRFQGACDAFFEKISSRFTEQDKEQHENLKQKNEIIDKIEALAAKEDNEENIHEQVRGFQAEWNKTGFVPFKEKDKIRKRYSEAMSKLLKKVKSVPGQKEGVNISYQLMLESWSSEAGGDRKLEQERQRHVRDLKKIENEIATLENNMEFFRNSKTASQMKTNLEKEITRLRKKMEDVQEKINLIRSIGV